MFDESINQHTKRSKYCLCFAFLKILTRTKIKLTPFFAVLYDNYDVFDNYNPNVKRI